VDLVPAARNGVLPIALAIEWPLGVSLVLYLLGHSGEKGTDNAGIRTFAKLRRGFGLAAKD
jgi:hypothetical protein